MSVGENSPVSHPHPREPALVGSRAARGQGNSWTWAEAEQRKASGDKKPLWMVYGWYEPSKYCLMVDIMFNN